MNEYVEDQLNVASKNLASFFYEKIGKQYLEDICSMKGWSDNNAILNFFLRTTLLLCTPNFILVRPPPHFLQLTPQIFYKISETKYLF